MIGRRLTIPHDPTHVIGVLVEPGDYVGPVAYPDDGTTSVWFLLPIARDPDVEPGARSICRVAQPPHQFRECADGSLEVRESIAVYNRAGDGHLWHGFLDEGHVWRAL